MKLLYVDTPFEGLQGGDKNRSKFIWHCLAQEFRADLLLIKGPEYRTKSLETHQNYRHLYSIATIPAFAHQSRAIYHFHPRHLEKFRKILENSAYDIIVFRFLSTYTLATLASRTLPNCKIVIDVDMLFSRVAELCWKQRPSIRNRYHLFEMMKLRSFEKQAFKHKFSYYFTNPVERDIAIGTYGLAAEYALDFPNMMPMEVQREYPASVVKYILFFGTMNSLANQDAFGFLVNYIYPSVESQLRRAGIQIWVAGKNPLDYYGRYQDDCLRIIGEVEDMNEIIANAEFVILPLRIASGTRTRILEAALAKKAVITTSIGVEGFRFKEKEIALRDKADDFASAMLELVEDIDKRNYLGKNLYHAARANYSVDTLCERFVNDLRSLQTSKAHRSLKIALITNRFYPEVGGAETNIHYQARELAKHHQLTVYCPKRIKRPGKEMVEGYELRRLGDVLNLPPQYPNLRAKTLCPTLLWYLMRGRYDIIQCYPAINYNNLLAFIASRISKSRFIMCFFDFVDYAAIFKSQNRVDKDILKGYKPNWYQKIVLSKMDKGFAIAEKELNFLSHYNPDVEFSPVPVLVDEYSDNPETPLLMKTWDERQFIILCLGRVSHIKGQDIALKAFCSIADKMPDARLIFVGRTDYENGYFEELKTLLAASGFADRVHFTGMVLRKKALSWLRYADIHLIPVRFMNSGAVVIESWASDTPVLQSDAVDPNLVHEGENGWNFSSEDVADCAAKILLAYHNRENLAQMAQNGKQQVMSTHTYEHLIELYNASYDRLMLR